MVFPPLQCPVWIRFRAFHILDQWLRCRRGRCSHPRSILHCLLLSVAFQMLTFAQAVGAADVGYLTAVSPAAATMFSLVLLRLKSKISKPIMMSLASLLYLSLCVFIYLATSEYLQNLGWKICILYSLGDFFHSRFF